MFKKFIGTAGTIGASVWQWVSDAPIPYVHLGQMGHISREKNFNIKE